MSDDYLKGLKATGKSIAENGGTPPSYTDAANNPKLWVIRNEYEKNKKKK